MTEPKCQESITALAAATGRRVAAVSLMDLNGQALNVSLPVGTYTFSYTLEEETECRFNVFVLRE